MEHKYPRIPHLPWSPGRSEDDVSLNDTVSFWRELVVITEKMDGENTTITRNKVYARSVDSRDHPSRHYVKSMASQFQWKLDEDIRICGENLYATHSIHYDRLESYFYVFGVFKGDRYLSWDMVELIAGALELPTVPVVWRGLWTDMMNECDFSVNGSLFTLDLNKSEGYVIRNEGSFLEKEFPRNIAKFVRDRHVQTDEHWMNQKMVVNELNKGDVL